MNSSIILKVLTANSEKTRQINVLEGKAENLLKVTTSVNARIIKVFYKMATCTK